MYNISVLSGNNIKKSKEARQTTKNIIDEVSLKLKNENQLLSDFTKMILEGFPKNLINIMSDSDFTSFFDYLFKVFNERKKKKYLTKFSHFTEFPFFIGNFSIGIIITDDRPFLIDSIREYFYEINIDDPIIIHPIFSVNRRSSGDISGISCPASDTENESFLFIMLGDVNTSILNKIKGELNNILKEVFLTVDSFPSVTTTLEEKAERLASKEPNLTDFIKWILKENFIIQGMRVLENIDFESKTFSDQNFGICKLKRIKMNPFRLITLNKSGDIELVNKKPILIDKISSKSRVKIRSCLDRIIFVDQKEGKADKVILILGLLSKHGINAPSGETPIVKDKTKNIIKYFNLIKATHDYKWAKYIFNTFPKTELFALSEDTLQNILSIIFSLHGKNHVSIFYKDFEPKGHFYIFLSASLEKYSTELVDDISIELKETFQGEIVDRSVRFDDHGYFYIHLHLFLKDLNTINLLDKNNLKKRIIELFKDWDEELYDILSVNYNTEKGNHLFTKYKSSFPESYKNKNTPREAFIDIGYMEKLKDYSASLYTDQDKVVLNVYSHHSLLLTYLMPIIDNLGIKVYEEDIYEIQTLKENYYIHAFFIADIEDIISFKRNYKKIIPELITAVIKDQVTNDKLNKLSVLGNLNYKQIDLIRSVRNYLEQIEYTFRHETINNTLINNHESTFKLVALFYEKFDPSKVTRDIDSQLSSIYNDIENIKSITEDKIMRHVLDIILNICRTNYFLKPKRNYISFKISSRKLAIIPEPKPLYEIFVHSAKMKGIHLRNGKIARGGLRLSNRPDDFRTEVLGLVKTQVVKNTIIVPTGSKGAFVIRDNLLNKKEDITEQYINFIQGLLDITDNYIHGKVIHPSNVIAYDETDPYLVVAADKGTATFSDTANAISKNYNFWLDDAFASGGSAGYDHKELGITARGGWECVKRHFRELGKNISKDEITVIGIGDMSGDVFGNGMLLSNHLKLLAAFNHRHILLDPNPIPSVSYKERKKLFKLKKSSWNDYNEDLISKGGGIYERSSKKILLSEEAKLMLDTAKNNVNGEELIQLILKMNADLLWNGGIGTYVKDISELNHEVGDSSNANVRINASELRVKVIGEGGNLGLTQKARIKFALNGGKINTDALDNSAGVDTSDYEVNIKILLNDLVHRKIIKDTEERNEMLSMVKNEIVKHVLEDNYMQSQVISCDLILSKKKQVGDIAGYLRKTGLLNHKLESVLFLKENRMPTRPELCVLLAYTKIYLFKEVYKNIDMNNEQVKKLYLEYFPSIFIEKYGKLLEDHPLKKEIAATILVNKVVNQTGISFLFDIVELTSKNFYELMINYLKAEEILKTDILRKSIINMDNKVDASMQYELLIEIEKTLKVAVEWFSYQDKYEIIRKNIEIFYNIVNNIPSKLNTYYKNNFARYKKHFISGGFNKKLAENICKIRYIKPAFDMLDVTTKLDKNYSCVIKNYYYIDDLLQLHIIMEGIKNIELKNSWDKVNSEILLQRYKLLQKRITEIITIKGIAWLKNAMEIRSDIFIKYNNFIELIKSSEVDNLIAFNVMLETLFNFLKKYKDIE